MIITARLMSSKAYSWLVTQQLQQALMNIMLNGNEPMKTGGFLT